MRTPRTAAVDINGKNRHLTGPVITRRFRIANRGVVYILSANPACITGSNLIRVIPTAARAWAGCCVCGIVVFGGAGQRWHPHRRLADTHLFGFYRLAFAGFQGFLFYFLSRTAAALFVSPILSYNPAELLRVVLVYGGSFPGADSCIALVAIRQCQVI